MNDRRKRTRCKVCKKRVNLAYKIKRERITFTCPNCLAHGELRYTPKVYK